VDERSAKSLILECNGAAKAAGVEPPMPSPQGLARCPTLTLLPAVRAEERAAQAALLETAFSLSSEVEATNDGCCTIDLRKAARETWEAACPQVIERLRALHLRAKIGVAPNPDLAFIAARRAEPLLVVNSPQAFLCQLAVAEIDPPAPLLATLHDWGIHTLGQLTSLPRGELADRLGPEADRLWQRAAGSAERLLQLVRPVEEFVEAFDFETEIETVEPLYFVLKRFLEQLCARLEASHRVAAKLDLNLPLEDRTCHERSFTIPSPTSDAEILFRIISAHLDGLQLTRRLTGVRLRMEPARPDRQQYQLFDNPLRDPNRFNETLARILAIVGPGNAGTVEIADTHRAESHRVVAANFQKPGDVAAKRMRGLATGLPLKRFRPPFPAQVRVVRHFPVQVFSEKAHGEIVDSLGPYRASGSWWEKAQWGAEEWDVEIADKGLFRISRNGGEWLVEGAYDTGLH